MGCAQSDTSYHSASDDDDDENNDIEEDKFLTRTQFRRTGGKKGRAPHQSATTYDQPRSTVSSVPCRSPVVVNPLTGRPPPTAAPLAAARVVDRNRAAKGGGTAAKQNPRDLPAALRTWFPVPPSDDRRELILAARTAWRDACARGGAGLNESARSRSGTASSTGSTTLGSSSTNSFTLARGGSLSLVNALAGPPRWAKPRRPVLRQLPKLTVRRMSRCSPLFAAFYPRTKALEGDAVRSVISNSVVGASSEVAPAFATPFMLGFSSVQHVMRSYHAPLSVQSFARRLELLHGNRARFLALLVRHRQPPGTCPNKRNPRGGGGPESVECTRQRQRGCALMSRWSTRRAAMLIDALGGEYLAAQPRRWIAGGAPAGRGASSPSRADASAAQLSSAYVTIPTAARLAIDWSSSEDDEEQVLHRSATRVRGVQPHPRRLAESLATGSDDAAAAGSRLPSKPLRRPRLRVARELSGDEHLHVLNWIRNVSNVAVSKPWASSESPSLTNSANLGVDATTTPLVTSCGHAHALAGEMAEAASLRIAFDAQFRASRPELFPSGVAAEDEVDEGAAPVHIVMQVAPKNGVLNKAVLSVAEPQPNKNDGAVAGSDLELPPRYTQHLLSLAQVEWDS